MEAPADRFLGAHDQPGAVNMDHESAGDGGPDAAVTKRPRVLHTTLTATQSWALK